jgi:hypothetical protein
MGIEQFDYLDEQAIAMTTLQNRISDGLAGVITNIDNINLTDITSLLDGDEIDAAKDALIALKTNLDSLKTALETMNSVNDNAKMIVAALRPLIHEEKRKIIGDGKTWYDYICKACSVQCPVSFRYQPAKRTLKYCHMKDDQSADYKENGTRTIN